MKRLLIVMLLVLAGCGEQLTERQLLYRVNAYGTITDKQAEIVSKAKKLFLNGLTSITDEQAESLGKVGNLWISKACQPLIDKYQDELAAKWRKAHEGGTCKADFARDHGMSESELQKILNRVEGRERTRKQNRCKTVAARRCRQSHQVSGTHEKSRKHDVAALCNILDPASVPPLGLGEHLHFHSAAC